MTFDSMEDPLLMIISHTIFQSQNLQQKKRREKSAPICDSSTRFIKALYIQSHGSAVEENPSRHMGRSNSMIYMITL
jgi:hypothetical protein